MSPLRTLLAVLAAEVAAILAALAAVYASSFVSTDGGVSAEDLLGFVSVSAAATLALSVFVYTPGLWLLCRRRAGCAPRPLFLLLASALLNVPAALALLLGLRAGTFSGFGEASIFLSVFLVAAFVFGLVFLRGRGGK